MTTPDHRDDATALWATLWAHYRFLFGCMAWSVVIMNIAALLWCCWMAATNPPTWLWQ